MAALAPRILPSPRILYVEDDHDNSELTVFVLTQAGFQVVSTDCGTKALQLAKTQPFDLYLIDNWLPDISGNDLCKRIREFDGDTPVLFYSGAAFAVDKARAVEAGAQGYLVKPVEYVDLINEVIRLTDGKP